ncbi:MAG: NTP transferase domain-containing protein [Bacteroidales bacterium]|jgi:molybdenum cofactor cytidylyltransferase|nr:NTP transferase domain-containing protein [Bacteroidales bacterium]
MKQKIKNTLNYSVIILAAGKSSRMGIPKWSLRFDEKSSFIKHIISEYHSFGCKEIILVINETDYSSFVEKKYTLPDNLKLVINKYPEWDRFYSLKLGVEKLSINQFVFIQNIDNPFVNHDLLINLLVNSENADLVVPEFDGRGGHPILINQQIIITIKNNQGNILHLKDFLNQFVKKKMTVSDERILVNINQLIDYQKYFRF